MKPELNFDMDALRALATGIDLGGFSHAAVRLNRSPSAVSMQLRKLETQTGQRLFKRTGRGLTLTEPGEVLLQYARRVLALNDEMGAAVGAIKDGGTVRAGMPQDITDAILPDLLASYAKARPKTHVEIKAGRNYTLADDVATGRLDLAVAFTKAGTGGPNTLATVPTVWISGKRPPKEKVVPLVVFDGPCLFREIAIDTLSKAKTPWRVAMTTPSLATLCCGLRAGLGYSVRTALAANTKGLTITRKLPALPSIDIVLYCAASLSPAAQTFRDLLYANAVLNNAS